MQLTNLRRPLQAAAVNSCRRQAAPLPASFSDRFAFLQLDVGHNSSSRVGGRRWASVKSQGAYIIPNKKTIPKKLGAKRTGDQYVIPGNILYKQRGTIWHAGENTILGRDHTIHAAVAGYVKYYRDPARHPKRQYIGVTFNRDDKLPYPPNAPRVRRLGMVAVPRKPEPAPQPTHSRSGIPFAVVRKPELPTASAPEPSDPAAASSTSPPGTPDPAAEAKAVQSTKRQTAKQRKAELAALRVAQRRIQKETRVLHLQSDYSYREHNWEIGRLVGSPGQVQGSGKTRSRKNMLRVRRRKRQITFGTLKNEARKRRERTLEAQRKAAEKRARREAEVKEEAAKAAKVKADGAEKTLA